MLRLGGQCNVAPSVLPIIYRACPNSRFVPTVSLHPRSFGHAIMEILSPEVLTLTWYRNIDGGDVPAESVTIERLTGCKSRR